MQSLFPKAFVFLLQDKSRCLSKIVSEVWKETLVVPGGLARLCIAAITDPLDESILEHFAQFGFETLGDGLDDVKIAFTPAQKGDG
jgi:hypothetical protein